jgi:hypothetical protein
MLMYGLPHGVVTAKTGCPATRSNASRSVREPSHPDRLIALRKTVRSDEGGDAGDEINAAQESVLLPGALVSSLALELLALAPAEDDALRGLRRNRNRRSDSTTATLLL